MRKLALQRQIPKRPHKPSSQKRGRRIGNFDSDNIIFHLEGMKESIGTNKICEKEPYRSRKQSMWWYHRDMYWKVSGQESLIN